MHQMTPRVKLDFLAGSICTGIHLCAARLRRRQVTKPLAPLPTALSIPTNSGLAEAETSTAMNAWLEDV